MPQTPRTTNDIIVRALNLIGELSPDEIPSGSQVTEGLYYLNDLFDYLSSAGIYIPFVRQLTFTMTVGKSDYSFSNNFPADIFSERIVEVDYVTVQRDSSSFPVRIVKRADLLNNFYVTNAQGIPGIVIFERSDQFSNLKFQPAPDFNYECHVRAKFMLDHLELYDNLDEVPPYYFRFLRYALAKELISVYPSSNWTPQAQQEYDTMFKRLTAANDVDLTINTDGALMNPYGVWSLRDFGIS